MSNFDNQNKNLTCRNLLKPIAETAKIILKCNLNKINIIKMLSHNEIKTVVNT